MKNLNSWLTFLALTLAAPLSPATAQTLDPSFVATSLYAPGSISSVVVQPDGQRIIVGSNLSRVNGTPLPNPGNNISRLQANGTLDAGFQQNVGATSTLFLRVRGLPNGQLLLTANSINSTPMMAGGITRREPLRLNADGTGDATFDAGEGAKPAAGATQGRVADMEPLPDGRLIVVGTFGSFNNVAAFGIARLTATGAVDASFNAGSGLSTSLANTGISTIGTLPNGKFIIGGNFTSYNGNACNGLARLNADGSFDPTFVQALGISSSVGSVVVTADGRILITGTLNGVPNSNRLARLLSTGAYDTNFTPPSTITGNIASGFGESVLALADNKVVFINGSTLTRLNANGTNDLSFQAPFISSADQLSSLALLPNGNVLVAGFFPGLDRGVVELTGTGALVPAFQPLLQTRGAIIALVRQADGKLVVGGNFSEINGQAVRRLARINADGTVDASYATGNTLNETVSDLALQADGRVVAAIGGVVGAGEVRRFLTTGAPDISLSAPALNRSATRVLVQPDGRILVGGSFTTAGGVTVPGFLRLLSDGSRDNSFTPAASGTSSFVVFRTFGLQPDGKIVVAGRFTPASGTAINTVARLENSGALDESFARGDFLNRFSQSSTPFNRLLVQPDSKILVVGDISSYNGTSRAGLARLNANGSLDAGFVPPAISGVVFTVALQPNSRLLVGGAFTGGGLPANLARLLPDGQADASFAGTAVPDVTVTALLIEPNGALVIGGPFTTVGGQPRLALARIIGASVLSVNAPHAVAEHTVAWPVPAHGTLFVAPAPTARPQSLELLDALGRSVRRQELRAGPPAQVSVEALPAGLYMLRVRYAEGMVVRAIQVQ
ncbi:hypothetical protein [Hymenobacter rubripertinctus]|uniref:T9SS C-terminal target domain-containing protein n=1 Tax=Hymenobacter rubripertinctus TaxID=2029981 RepID=A0A418R8L1_9BACT|nr:hypothetical protein [Hymenobacter rubripertinctus]RIY13746.1 hypothetical protein D0T11_01300 [Hymenobacter rubripertinctus]